MSEARKLLWTALLWILYGLGAIIALIVALFIFIHELILQGEEEIEKLLKEEKIINP